MLSKQKSPLWPADKVERRPVQSLVPYAKNARTHSEDQIKSIAASIKEWGWTVPVLVDEAGGLIAGHGRVLAAKSLGLVEIPVMVAHGWTDVQKRAYVLADNQLATNAGWDNELLKVELGDLQEAGFDLDLTGFDVAEIETLMQNADDENPGGTEARLPPMVYKIIITCADEAQQVKFLNDFEKRGIKCSALIS